MKKLENILLKGCGFTILILTLFYSFAAIGNPSKQNIGFATFAVILAFGILISFTTLLLDIKSISLGLRLLMHYASTLIAFCIVFITTGNLLLNTPAKIFSAVIIFSFLYAIIFLSVYFIKRIVNKLDRKLDEKSKKASTYKSIYTKK